MGKRVTDYPHTISFRLTDEAWLGIQKQIAGSKLTAHEWCRKAALERLNNNYDLSKSERLLLEHFVRAQYLVTQGFQLLADGYLTGDQWKNSEPLPPNEPPNSPTTRSPNELVGAVKASGRMFFNGRSILVVKCIISDLEDDTSTSRSLSCSPTLSANITCFLSLPVI